MPCARVALLAGLTGQLLFPCGGVTLRAGLAGGCLDAVPGDACHRFVTWALDKGLEKHPDWFPSFQRSDSEEHNFKQIQEILYSHNKAGCDKPCAATAQANEIGNLEAELKALEAMKYSPSLETLREEKRQLIHNLQTADKLEAEVKARHLQNLQTAKKSEADLKALEAMNTTLALETLRAEKRLEIRKLQADDKSETELKMREIQRLQDPAATAKEAAPAAPAEEVAPALAQERPQEAEVRSARSDLVGKLEGELKAMDQIHRSPALETLRTEKRQFINNLQRADKLEAEVKARHLQNHQTAKKWEADLKALGAMDNTPALEVLVAEKRTLIHQLETADKADTEQTTQELERLQDPANNADAPAATADIFEPEAIAAGRQSWWQRRWRDSKAEAKEEAVATSAESPAVAAEEAKPEAVPAAPDKEAKPVEAHAPVALERVGVCLDAVPGDSCHEFVRWVLDKGLEQHPDWFPSFKRSASDEHDFKDIQEILHSKNKAGCGKPC